jgi:hypothetical protein
MAEHIEGGVDELRKVDQFQNEAQPSLAVIVRPPPLLLPDELRQSIAEMIQAGHHCERVIDRRGHRSDGHLDELVDRVLDILGGSAHIPDMASAAAMQ